MHGSPRLSGEAFLEALGSLPLMLTTGPQGYSYTNYGPKGKSHAKRLRPSMIILGLGSLLLDQSQSSVSKSQGAETGWWVEGGRAVCHT